MFFQGLESESSSSSSSVDISLSSQHGAADLNGSSENSSETNNNNNNSRFNMIISYGKELLCIIAFILTTYASVQNSAPKVSRAVTPVPFFSKGSLVEDYYYGQLSPTQNKVSLSEVSFVLYYAPWCSESQFSRSSYDHVAKLFYKEAYFSAINCWQPGGECRSQYTKIQSWPILMAYQPNGIGIQYQKNLWTESALTKFVNAMLNPIQRLNTPDDLLEMMTSKDAVIVSFVDLAYNAKQYSAFYQASLKFLEKDPFQEIGFAVVTGETAESFGVELVPTIRAYLWNETLEYNGNTSWTSKDINSWINKHLQQVSLYLSPPGTKSTSLAPYLKQGPVLLLFTPRNFYTDLSDAYVMLQQLGMEYYNCNNDNWVQEMAREYLVQRRKENKNHHKNLLTQCHKQFSKQFTSENIDASKCHFDKSVSVSFVNVLNSSKNTDGKFKIVPNVCEVDDHKKPVEPCDCEHLKINEEVCLGSTRDHLKYSYQANTKEEDKLQTSMIDQGLDELSPDNIMRYNFRRKCQMLKLAETKSEILFFDDEVEEESDEEFASVNLVSGLACKYNKTFSLIAIDSISFHTFAERLGIDILEIENKTVAVIMDHENESTFLMDEAVNLNSLSRFIYNYYKGRLPRFLRTNSVQYKHTHFFDLNEFMNEVNKNKVTKNFGSEIKKQCAHYSGKVKDQHVTIKEINSEDFEEIVIGSNKTVVVLFYSANCAFCSQLSHSLLTVSQILSEMSDIEFLRIDGDKNDLKWQYTMSEWPSLITFPSYSKSESRRFPGKMQINVANVLGFVLANLDRPQRLLGLVLACNYKRQNSVDDCVEILREEISDNISISLREWRKLPKQRPVILRTIQKLKTIYLSLFKIQHSCDFVDVEKDARSLVKLWKGVKV